MAKRFTDTAKWSKAWFRKLSPQLKCVWMFLCDQCDHAGVWEVDDDAFNYFIGADLKLVDVIEKFDGRIVRLRETKILIKDFVEFQYGDLNPDNRVHKSVLNRLEKEGANKALKRPLEGPKDKDKDKDKDKERGSGGKITKADLDTAYQTYPLKKGKTAGLAKAKTEIKTPADLVLLKTAIQNYRADLVKNQTPAEFIKHFSTFMSSWRDWLDQDAGHGESFDDDKSDAAEKEAALFREAK